VKVEETWIHCQNATLYSELRIPDRVPARALLICHFMDANGYHGLKIYTQLADEACENGFVSLVFDYRGVGNSTGEFDYGDGEQLDVKCAFNFLASRPEVLPNDIFVVGHSLGAAVSLYALQNETRVKGLVLWSPPKNHDYNVKKFVARTRGKLGLYLFLFFSRIDRFINVSRIFRMEVFGIKLRLKEVRGKLMKLNEVEVISKVEGLPVLIVVGDADNIHGVDEAREVFSAAHDPKTLAVIDSADHSYSGKEEELVARTIAWMKKMGSQ
jgi:alpha/beta superfamily hydrolase